MWVIFQHPLLLPLSSLSLRQYFVILFRQHTRTSFQVLLGLLEFEHTWTTHTDGHKTDNTINIQLQIKLTADYLSSSQESYKLAICNALILCGTDYKLVFQIQVTASRLHLLNTEKVSEFHRRRYSEVLAKTMLSTGVIQNLMSVHVTPKTNSKASNIKNHLQKLRDWDTL